MRNKKSPWRANSRAYEKGKHMHENTTKKTTTPENSVTMTQNQSENGEVLLESINRLLSKLNF